MKNIALLAILIVVIFALSNLAAKVDHSNGFPDVMKTLFPEKYVNKEEQKAIETGMAPFAEAENAAKPVELDPAIQYDPLGDAISVKQSLDMAHRHEAAVSEWVTEAMSEVLNFTIDGYENHKAKEMSKWMSPNAIAEFESFLKAANIPQHMRNHKYQLKSFVQDIPQIRSSGPVDGIYRWLYDVPVNMTFLPEDTKSYEDLKEDDYQQEAVRFRVQVRRTAEGGTEGMMIETWQALPRVSPP